MKAIIEEGCISCGMCEGTCPEVFRMNDEGMAEVCGDVTATNEESVREAIDGCPVSVISMEE